MSSNQSDRFRKDREAMVQLIRSRGITDRSVLNALLVVRREQFVPLESRESAYDDSPLPIGSKQTISQPFVVAIMVTSLQLKSEDRVLEIGTGSGYAAAIIGQIAKDVVTVERLEELVEMAKRNLAEEAIENVKVCHADGTDGWPEDAPYDAIVVAAGGPQIPEPLIEQLNIGGRLVIPVGPTKAQQQLIRLIKTENGLQEEDLGAVRFVPLVGSAGW